MQISQYLNNVYSSLHKQIRPFGVKVLATFGLFLALRSSFKALSFLYGLIPSRGHDLAQRYGRGSWAVITGATSGVGSVFANELAGRGFNVVLIGRDERLLADKVEELREKFGSSLQIKAIKADLIHSGEDAFYDHIFEEIRTLDISILVNSAGIGGYGPFHEFPDSAAMGITTVNAVAPVLLTRRLLPKLLQRHGRSAVINVTSFASIYPIRNMGIYSATKGFLDMFSRDLQMQYGDKIDFLSCRYGTITTKMNAYLSSSQTITPEQAVTSVLSKVGNVPYTFGHWKHQIFGNLAQRPFIGRIVMDKLVTEIKDHVNNVLSKAEQTID